MGFFFLLDFLKKSRCHKFFLWTHRDFFALFFSLQFHLFHWIRSANSNMSSLERKIKKTLIEQSILDEDELDNSDEDASATSPNTSSENYTIHKDDEIANEIRNLQNELKVVTKQCKSTLNNLLEISKQGIEKQEIRKKISLLDSEVCHWHFLDSNFSLGIWISFSLDI